MKCCMLCVSWRITTRRVRLFSGRISRGRINSKKGEILGCAEGSESHSRGSSAVRKRFRNGLELVQKRFGNGCLRQSGNGSRMWALGGVRRENCSVKCEPFPNHFPTDSRPLPSHIWRLVGNENSNLGTATSGT